MRDIALAWLAKDAASYGMADYATKIGLVLARGFGNVGIGCFAVKRDMSRNIESADTLESQVVEKLYGAAISAAVLSRFVTRSHGAVAQQGRRQLRRKWYSRSRTPSECAHAVRPSGRAILAWH